MLEVIIVDDEKNSRELLSTFLNKYCQDVTILAEADSIDSGLKTINQYKPDLVFLDIELSGGTGFDILDQAGDIPFLLCFVTGYSEYAIKAIKYNAFDYLLKPLDIDELKAVVKKAAAFVSESSSEAEEASLMISDGNKINLVKLKEIVYLSVNGNYTMIHLLNGKRLISSENLSYFENALPSTCFSRIHQSYIIHLTCVKGMEIGRTGTLVLESDVSLPIASRRKKDFVKKLKAFVSRNNTNIT